MTVHVRLAFAFTQWIGCVLFDWIICRWLLYRPWKWKWPVGFFGVATLIEVWLKLL